MIQKERLRMEYLAILELGACAFKNYESFLYWYENKPKVCSGCGAKNSVLIFFEAKDLLIRSKEKKVNKTLVYDLSIKRKNSILPFDENNSVLKCVYCVNKPIERYDWIMVRN